QTRAISRMYFLPGSPNDFVSGIGATRSPASTTVAPSATNRSPIPAIRNADGPMSTPRRLPPRSSETPMMWTGRITAANVPHGLVVDGSHKHPIIYGLRTADEARSREGARNEAVRCWRPGRGTDLRAGIRDCCRRRVHPRPVRRARDQEIPDEHVASRTERRTDTGRPARDQGPQEARAEEGRRRRARKRRLEPIALPLQRHRHALAG